MEVLPQSQEKATELPQQAVQDVSTEQPSLASIKP